MSTTVDERVVEMRFDNKQFEQNIQTSLSSIDKLKRSLNLEGAAKGLETVNDAAQKCNMSPLTNAVETVRVRFSALEVMAITALQNITNSALAAGKNLVSAFTVDPIKSGFEEYETQINAVQTILANTSSKGTTLDQVNNALDELNHYADMTIYNFTEMTRNIGTFTAAGVDLDTSVAAIKGIANLAAVSGSNSQQASTAMYQLSQALAAGTVKLQDWNSVVNAGMGGQVFQDALKETAKVHGIAIDEMIKDEGSFRETLSKGWLTSDILTETLAKFTGDLNEDQLRTMGYADDQIKSIMEMGKTANDAATKVKTFTQLFDTLKEAAQSGWTQSWEIIVGDFEEAKELLTEVSDTFSAVINASADARNKMLQDWKDLGGRTMMIEAVKNVFEGLVSVAKPVREAFNEIFPPMTGKQLAEITERIRDLTAKFKMGEESSKNLKNTFKGVFAVLDIVGQAFKAVAGGVGELIGLFIPAGNGVLSLTGSFGEYLVKLDETVKKTDVFGKAVSTVVDIVNTAITFVKTAGEKVKEFGKAAGEKFDFPGFELFHSFLERVHDRMAQIGDGAGKMKSGVIVAFEMMGEALEKCKFLKVMEALWTAVKVIAGGIADAVGTMMGTLAEKLGNADFSGVLDILNSIAVGGIALSVSKFLKSVTEPLEWLNGVLEGVTGILDGVRGCFEAFQTNLKAGTLLKIGAAIALLAGSIVAISLIDSDKLSASLGAITVLFANLLGAMAIFNKISSDTGKVSKACTAMIAMSVAVSILAGALKKVSDLDWGELARGLVGIAGLTTIVVASSKAMASSQKQVMKGATSLIIFGAAIKILASACEDLSKLQWDELGRGLTGVGVLFAEIAVFLRVAKFNGKMISTATGIVILSAAMKVLASACKDFGQMEWSEIGKGLAGIGGLLAELAVFLRVAKFNGKMISTATGIVILSAAMKVLASACKDFGQMEWSEIGKGLAGIGGLLAELAVFTNLAGNAKHVMSTGVALIAIGAAMKIFASAVKDFGQLQWDEIGRGLTAMGGALAEVAIAVNLMPKNMIGIGTGLVIVGGALETIANCMSKFGGMQWEEIGRGLTVMGGALAELAISLNFMKGTLGGSAALLVASGALAVLAPVLSILGALSWEAIAKGLISIAGAFTIIGVAGAVLTPLVPTILALSGAFALIGVGVLTIGAGLLAAGTGLSALAIGFTALATAGAAGATAIVAALTVIVTGIAGLIPAVLTKVGEGIIAICKVIAAGAPAIGEAVKAVVLTLIDVFVSCVPQLADGALQLVVGVLAALVTYTPQIVDLAFKFLIGILDGIASNLPSLIKAGVDVLVAFFAGIVDALRGIDTGALLKGIAGIGLLSAIMLALSATASLVPGAMVGILGMGAVVAEMALVLAAVGLLSKLPGLSWLIGEGGKLLQGIGTAIGQFVGGIVGGFMSGVSSQFPQIGADLSTFMNNVQPFLQGASQIQPSMMDGVKALAETVLILTAADILQGLTSWLTGGSSLSKFGEELVPFGEAMRDFSLAIGNMDGEIVANAATAGKALAEMAATIPNTGGLVSFFAGENDMTAFGKQLVPFGEAMRQFGDAITGLDANAVTEAAIAGKAMAEMATTIPNSGGVVGFFAGENDMGEFGKQLVPFGEAMKAFGDAVRGLEADAIVNSATAGKALVELADTVPNTGGVVAFFTGNNDVDTFGEKLVPFGEAMKAYSEAIMGMDSAAITNSATAGKALVELANTIPNTGGLVSWFTGDNDLGSFGDSLVQFGSGIKSYSDSISGIDTGIMSSVITQVNRLVEMAKGMAELDTSGMSGFSTALIQLGNNGIDGFINAFTDASGRVTSAATSMLTTFINAANAQKGNLTSTFTTMMQAVLTTLTNYQTQFNTAGANLMIKLIAGVKSKDYETRNAFVNILSSCLTAIANKYPEFQNAGMQCMIKFIAGVKEKAEEVKTAFTGNLNASVTAIRDYHDQFKQAGTYLVEGFADGISENTYRAEAKARAMARAAAEAAEDELDEHSPSRVGYHIGDFFGLGFVNAIGTYAVKAYNASAEMADSAKTGLGNAIAKVKDMIDNGVDGQPTIRPILDLSDVEEKSHRLNTLFSRSQALTVSTGIAAARGRNLQNEDTNPNTGNSYNFTQNNYSPKALSRTEIYRQTKNQFSAMERMVET